MAPGPIWTPLIPSSFDAETVAKFGQDTPMGRMGQPSEVAPAYLFLASDDAVTSQDRLFMSMAVKSSMDKQIKSLRKEVFLFDQNRLRESVF